MTRITTCALVLLLPGGLVAQELEIAPFASRNTGLEGTPGMVGLGVTWYPRPLGLRVSTAVDVESSPLAPLLSHAPSSGMRAWSGDLDVILSGRRAGVPLGGVDVTLFTGLGAHGLSDPDGLSETAIVWSYGSGVAVPLARRLSVGLEARFRMPFESGDDPSPLAGGGWEYRSGIAVRLGSPPGRGARPGPAPGISAAPSGEPLVPPAVAPAPVSMIRTGDQHLGVRYVWGGSSPAEGFDCSGFVQYVYARNGIALPRVSRDQARVGQRVEPVISNLRVGDLLFFAGRSGVIDHVAMYAGDNTILHASSRRGAVTYDRLDSRQGRWYVENLVTVRRVLP